MTAEYLHCWAGCGAITPATEWRTPTNADGGIELWECNRCGAWYCERPVPTGLCCIDPSAVSCFGSLITADLRTFCMRHWDMFRAVRDAAHREPEP